MKIEQLQEFQSMSLKDKEDMSFERIESWHDHWKGKIYVSFSGGLDSTVLLHLVRRIFPEVPAVFCDTGLEYPEIRDFVKTIDNVTFVKPKLTFRQVIDKYGYPVISKEQSQYIYEIKNTKSDSLRNLRLNGNEKGRWRLSGKYKYLLSAPFNISDKCCFALKKSPAHSYDKQTGAHPLLGMRTEESHLRRNTWLRYGCNMYGNNPYSLPLAFWKHEDIKEYICKYSLPYSKIYDMGYDRTGCMFCMYGVQHEKEPNRFQKMAISHPQLYKYCIDSLGLGKVLDYMGLPYASE